MTQVSEKTTFGLVPYHQFQKMTHEKPAVMRLWFECWECDPYGSRWMQMATHLTGKTLKEAKARIRELKLFEFKSEVSLNPEGIRHWQMYVINLEGSKSTGIVETPTSNRTGVKNYPTRGNETPHIGQETIPHGVEKDPTNPLETQSQQVFQQSSLPSKNIKESTATSESIAAVSFSCHDSPLQSPDLAPGSEASKMDVQEQTSLSSETLRETQTGTLHQKDFDVELSVRKKDSAPSHLKVSQSTLDSSKPLACWSRSHQDAPQGVLPLQMTNPTLRDFEDGLEVFSLSLAEHLMELAEVADRKGRLGELKLSDLRTTIRSVKDDVAILAVQHVIQKVDSINNLGGYLRKALIEGYKPAQAQVAHQTTKVSQQESKPAPERLEEFLSEENLERFVAAQLEGEDFTLCVSQLFKEWDKGDELHESRINYWMGSQRRRRTQELEKLTQLKR